MDSSRIAASMITLGLAGVACGDADTPASQDSSGASSLTAITMTDAESSGGVRVPTSSGVDGSSGHDTASSSAGDTEVPKFDVEGSVDVADTGPPPPTCKVVDDMDAVGECTDIAPPNSFEPDVQWTWTGATDPYSMVTPLVANLTDDNSDGAIDLCDVPDVVVVAAPSIGWNDRVGHLYVLDGETGEEHFAAAIPVDASVTPALGDIDDDGLPEIVTAAPDGTLIAFEHDGSLKWQGDAIWVDNYASAVALADLDNDTHVEIIGDDWVADHDGVRLWTTPDAVGLYTATAAADLDDDGALEVVLGNAAYFADGSLFWSNAQVAAGFPQIAQLDDDPQPEVLVTNSNGISVLEHDGTTKFADLRPTGDSGGWNTWLRPATVHDFDGDQPAEFAVSSANHYTVYESDATIVWSATVSDASGIAGGTAFDFLGDGTAEAMYADETTMFVFDDDGIPILQTPRTSGTLIEYPVVADIDNDGSAEIVVVSDQFGGDTSPTVQVIRDVDDRWIQARRIWNQHTYHVTNVREDGTIPQYEPPHHTLLNTFRTNAQIEGGGICKPPAEG
ncbi:MAG: VCBS repeat-containing protein [Myxococcales bacterium]|nr:VCBS repeat-containing protein [Myxococcales bacterium]